jgi:hypothetical protein
VPEHQELLLHVPENLILQYLRKNQGKTITIIIKMDGKGFWVMVFNTTFNNISVILWRSVLLLEETRVPREKCRPAASH